MAINFNIYSKYYDLLYRDKNYQAEANYVINSIQNTDSTARSILELGCGTGAHAEYLCAAGFEVTGIERSEDMVIQANHKQIKGFNPIVGNITNYTLDKKFDAVISLFHVISYLNSNDDLIACFSSASSHLNKGGVFLFDVWYSPAVYYQEPETRIKRMSDERYEITRLAEPHVLNNENVVEVNYEIMINDTQEKSFLSFKEQHCMRHFSIPEIALLARLTGFKLLKVEEFLTLNIPSKNTWGVCFILMKSEI